MKTTGDEEICQNALNRFWMLDTPEEQGYDDIKRMALISLSDHDTQRLAAAV